MSAYQCPGCGLDYPLSVECPRCEGEPTSSGHDLRRRLVATREAMCEILEQHTGTLAELLTACEELQAERRKSGELQRAVVGAHRRRQEESRRRLRHRDELKRLRALAAAYSLTAELPPNRWDCPQCGPDTTATFEECCANCGATCMVIQDGVWRHARNREAAAAPHGPGIGQFVRLTRDRVGYHHPAPSQPGRGVQAVDLPAGSIGRVVRYDPVAGPPLVEFTIGEVRAIAEFRQGDGEILAAGAAS